MKPFFFWISERLDSLSVRVEILAEFFREKSREEDYIVHYYPEGPEGDE